MGRGGIGPRYPALSFHHNIKYKIMVNRVLIGIDPSLTSTGICVRTNDNDARFACVASHMTRAMKNVDDALIHYVEYDKRVTNDKTMSFAQRERNKIENIIDIVNCVEQCVVYLIEQLRCDDTCECVMFIESNSYASSSTSAIIELAFLNFALRERARERGCRCVAVPPCANKKNAVGNGQADKQAIVYSFTTLFKKFNNTGVKKLDDIADAYFLTLNDDE